MVGSKLNFILMVEEPFTIEKYKPYILPIYHPMKKLLIALLVLFSFHQDSYAQSIFKHGNLTVTKIGHYLQFSDGTPFFWLGDTAWELFHRLTLSEIREYLDNRKEKGFTVIQAVVSCARTAVLSRETSAGNTPRMKKLSFDRIKIIAVCVLKSYSYTLIA